MRAAVRSFTLSLYAVDSPALQSYLADGPAEGFFSVLGSLMTESCQVRIGPGTSHGLVRRVRAKVPDAAG